MQRGVDVRAIELIDLAAFDIEDPAANDFGLRLVRPLEKRAIDKAEALRGIDVAYRHAERIELAL